MSLASDLWMANLAKYFEDKEKLQKYLDDIMICVEYNAPETEMINTLVSMSEKMSKRGIKGVFVGATKEPLDQGLRTTITYRSSTVKDILDPKESAKFLALIWLKAYNHRLTKAGACQMSKNNLNG